MKPHKNILFIGSIGLENTEDVFNTLGSVIGERAKRYPDGETGMRAYWIRWVDASLAKHSQLKLIESRKVEGIQDNTQRPFYKIKKGVSPQDLDLGKFGYAEYAIESYSKFKALKQAGHIPETTRFQVSLPTPMAILVGFFDLSAQQAAELAVEKVFKAEVDQVLAAIPNDELAVQWDVCYEIIAYEGGPAIFYKDILPGTAERVGRLTNTIPAATETGIHLCYGDPGHKHIIEPQDLQTSVIFANAICKGASREVSWIHMAVPHARDDAEYFAPLQGLELPASTELYLGLVHKRDGVEGAKKRILAAEKSRSEFGIATECGFGRRPPETILELLQIHSDISDLG
mgnify:CR=1 FL=1